METKEAFSDGCSEGTESWYSIIQEFVETEISDEAMAEAAFVRRHYARRKSSTIGVTLNHITQVVRGHPSFLATKWCGDVIDPSARVLTDVYDPVTRQSRVRTPLNLDTDAPKPIEALKGTG